MASGAGARRRATGATAGTVKLGCRSSVDRWMLLDAVGSLVGSRALPARPSLPLRVSGISLAHLLQRNETETAARRRTEHRAALCRVQPRIWPMVGAEELHRGASICDASAIENLRRPSRARALSPRGRPASET